MDEKGTIHREPDYAAMRRDLFSSSISDERTRATIKETWESHKVLLEPHGAVGWRGFLDYCESEPLGDAPAVVLETAHPAKFPAEIEALLGFTPEVPETLARLDGLKEDFDTMNVDYEKLKEYLLARYRD
jgi:threonine synthase